MTVQTPDPIPVYSGDDWSFAFTYASSSGAAVDLTGRQIIADLYRARMPGPLELTDLQGQIAIIDPAAGSFAVGVPRTVTSSIQASPADGTTGTALHVYIVVSGHRRTIGV